MAERKVGRVSHYFGHIQVAAVVLEDELKVGDTIHVKGHTSDFTQTVESMQLDNADIAEAKAGDSIGVKVPDRVRPGDHVYKVT